MEYLLILLICMLAGFLSASISFGYAIICMILLPLVIDIKYAVLVTVFASIFLFSSIVIENLFIRKVRLKPSLVFIPAVILTIFRFVGMSLYTVFTSMQLVVILAVFMVTLNVYFLGFSNKVNIKPNFLSALITGILGGLFGGLYGISGPPLVAYYHSVEKDTLTYTTYVQLMFFFGCVTSIIFHISVGNVNMQVLKYTGAGSIGVIFGALTGYRLYKRINRQMLSKIIRLAILAMSIFLVVKTSVQILSN